MGQWASGPVAVMEAALMPVSAAGEAGLPIPIAGGEPCQVGVLGVGMLIAPQGTVPLGSDTPLGVWSRGWCVLEVGAFAWVSQIAVAGDGSPSPSLSPLVWVP